MRKGLKKEEIKKLIKEMKKRGKSNAWIYTELKNFILPSFGWVPKSQKDLEALKKLVYKVK